MADWKGTAAGTATLLVAASDALAAVRSRADYLCDGTADQVEIEAAIAALPAGGGRIVLSEGTFSITAAIDILAHQVNIEGQGIGTVVQAAAGSETIDVFVFGDGGDTAYANLRIANLKINAAAQKTSNTGLKFNKCFKVWIENVYLEWQYRSVHILNTTQVFMSNCPLRNQKENGIVIESAAASGFDWYLNNIVMDNPDVSGGNAGIGLQWLGGETLVMHGADIMRFNVGMEIQPPDAKECRWAFFHGVILDTCTDNGLHIGNADTGNVAGLTFVNCWTGTNTNYGVLIDKAGSGYLEGIRFIGHKSFNNGLAGIRLAGGNDLFFQDCDVVSNSTTSSGTRHGFEVAEAVSEWTIEGCRCTNGYGHGATQQNGINIDSGATDNYMILNNDLRGNAGSAMSNGATGTTRRVENNLGYVTKNKGTATVASGQTTIAVNHGLSVTPALTDIQVTPTLMSNAAKFWITTPTSSQFTVNVDADPGAGTATFVWQAEVI